MALIMARPSMRPEPSAFATTTLPARIACIRPGTPSREPLLSSSGSAKSPSMRAQDHVGPLQSRDGADMHLIVPHDEVAAFDEKKAEIAREIGVLEIGLAERPGVSRQMRGSTRSAWLARPERKFWKNGASRSTFIPP